MSVIINIDLVPVIELEPLEFGSYDNFEGDEGDVYERWKFALCQAGLGRLEPIQKGSWHVPISELTDPKVLEKILDVLIEIDINDFALDYFVALSGGLCPMNGKEVLFEPQCCGDLAAIHEWQERVATTGPDYEDLWIGHPSARVRRTGTTMVFELREEYLPCSLIAQFTASIISLEKALMEAEKAQREFASRLTKALEKKLDPPIAAQLALLLAGIATHDDLNV